jgi:thiol-disulfide isomerase/thioredoxin
MTSETKWHELEATLLDGSRFKLSEHRDKLALVVFFGRQCADCRRSAPVLDHLYQRSGGAGFLPVALFVCALTAADRENIASLGLAFPTGWIPREQMCRFLGVPVESEVHGPIHVIAPPSADRIAVHSRESELFEEPETALPALVAEFLRADKVLA